MAIDGGSATALGSSLSLGHHGLTDGRAVVCLACRRILAPLIAAGNIFSSLFQVALLLAFPATSLGRTLSCCNMCISGVLAFITTGA
mmetsp:Transcript_97410/g.231774  ORF Transcript_97410/g.231774 Transcript_97410/m.231774 type:complete len:87 (-) Transcript_97410:27-287(-)